MAKIISAEKLNALLVNIKADKALEQYKIENNIECQDCQQSVHLVKVVLRTDFAKNQAGTPTYVFIKRGYGATVIVDVITGSVQVIDPDTIASETNVKVPFRINGITYGLKDTINGHKRFRPLSYEPKKPRKKIKVKDVYDVCDA